MRIRVRPGTEIEVAFDSFRLIMCEWLMDHDWTEEDLEAMSDAELVISVAESLKSDESGFGTFKQARFNELVEVSERAFAKSGRR